jgi:CheY-like chemotaxis protein
LERQPEVDVQEVLPRGNEHILYVDDEPMLAALGKAMLEDVGYAVVTSTNPEEALEAFRAAPGRFDLVVTDMTMPFMTGDALAGRLREISSDIPVILCTGFSTKITKEKAKTLGITDLLMKPLIKPTLAKAVRKALDEEEFRD